MSAYITDYPRLLSYQQIYDTKCQLKFLPQIEQVFYGAVLHQSLPIDVIDGINEAILVAQSDGTLTRLNRVYFSSTTCTPALPPVGVLFSQLSGLWIIIGVSIFIGIMGSLYSIWRHHIHPAHLEENKSNQSDELGSEKVARARSRLPSIRTVKRGLSRVLSSPQSLKSSKPSPTTRMTSFRPHNELTGECKASSFRPHFDKMQEMRGGGEGSLAVPDRMSPYVANPLPEEA